MFMRISGEALRSWDCSDPEHPPGCCIIFGKFVGFCSPLFTSVPHLGHADVALQLNSFRIPYHISFLKPPGSRSYPCQHKGTYTPLSSSMSFSSVHHTQFHIEISCDVEVSGSTTRSFSKYFKDARDKGFIQLCTFT